MDTASQTTLVSDYDQFFNDMWEEVKSELDEKEFQKVRQIEDRAAFEAFLDEVRTQSTDYKDGTKSKWRRMRGHVQRICAQLSEFLECYSGVAEVAKGIHQQGGALGYGTLSVLLMVGASSLYYVILLTHTACAREGSSRRDDRCIPRAGKKVPPGPKGLAKHLLLDRLPTSHNSYNGSLQGDFSILNVHMEILQTPTR